MVSRILYIIVLLSVTGLLPAQPEKIDFVFNPKIPDTIRDIKVELDIKQVTVIQQGNEIRFYCLCADITNQNRLPKEIRIRYQCRGRDKIRKIEVGGKQQKKIMVDKCMITEEAPHSMNEYFGQVLLEYDH